MRKTVLAVLTALMVAGCNNPKDVALPANPSLWDDTVKQAVQKLSDEDRALVAAYAMRSTVGTIFGGAGIPPGTTIGSAIEDQKKWVINQKEAQAKQEALKQKLAAEQEQFKNLVEQAVTVTVLEKRLLPKNYSAGHYSERQYIKVGFENKSGKDIAGVSGEIKFFDIFDKEVGAINFGYDKGIKASSQAIWEGTRNYNQFLESHKQLANIDEGKYTTKFFPETIVFSDGTKLSVATP